MLTGIDISAHQSTTPSLAGLAFVGIRATIANRVDAMYATHLAAARGLVTIAYHFNWSTLPVLAQADLFLATSKGADLLALDVELNDDKHGTITPPFSKAQATEFIARVHAAGRTIGLYHSRGSNTSKFPDYGQNWNWVAQWTSYPPNVPYAFWQDGPRYIDGRRIDGDYFNGDQSALLRLAGRDMTPSTKGTGIPLGTVTINGTGHLLLSPLDPKGTRYGPRAAGEVLTVLAVVDLKDGAGNAIDIDGNQPPKAGRDQVYLVDAPTFGVAAYALRADCTPLVLHETAAIAAATDPLRQEIAVIHDQLTSANAELAVAKTKISAARSALS